MMEFKGLMVYGNVLLLMYQKIFSENTEALTLQ